MQQPISLTRARQILLLSVCAAAIAPAAHAQKKTPQVKFTSYRLANGLRVILAPDKSAPVVALSVTYDVGSRNEKPGRTGFAHLFEHMMFQGSANVGKGEHFMLINDNGGTFNGTTNSDRTNYFAEVPANQLDMLLFLESDRMRALDITQVNLDNQRAVVQEERRQSYDNQPYGASREALSDLAYSSFAYKHSTIGSMADLNAATLDDVKNFFKIYYAPNNAAIAIVGAFDVNEVKKKVEKYFGSIPSQPTPPPVEINEPPSTAEKRKTLTDPLARLTQYSSAYRTVPGDDADAPALNLLSAILSRGRTSRFNAAITEKQLALGANAFAQESRGVGLFSISATLPPNGKVETVEKAIETEIAKIQANGVTDEELNRAKVQARVGSVSRLNGALGKANALSQFAIFYNDPGRINTQILKIEAVTTSDIRRVAQKYLIPTNRVVVITEPAAPADFGGLNP